MALGHLRSGAVIPRRDFYSVSVAIPHLGKPERRSWERELNEPLRATGDIMGLVGSLVGTVAYVLWVATATNGVGGYWGLLATGIILIAAGGAVGKMIGGWYAIQVFRHRAAELERMVESLRDDPLRGRLFCSGPDRR